MSEEVKIGELVISMMWDYADTLDMILKEALVNLGIIGNVMDVNTTEDFEKYCTGEDFQIEKERIEDDGYFKCALKYKGDIVAMFHDHIDSIDNVVFYKVPGDEIKK